MKRFAFASLIFMAVTVISYSISEATTAIITEIKLGHGAVEIRHSRGKEWKPALPLQSLNAGDTIRVSKDANVVIMFSGGEEIVRISSTNSPYEVKVQKAPSSRTQKAQAVLSEVAGFLAGKKKDVLSAPLAVRGLQRPPAIISPKDTKVSIQSVFEWIGTPRIPYTIRLMHENTKIWEKVKIYKTHIAYPKDEKPLSTGIRYLWEIETAGYPPVNAWFEIATDSEKKGIEDELSFLNEPDYRSFPKSTIAVLKYGILVSRGFHAEGRNILIEALAADPDEPVLHILLGDFYDNIGLKDLAAEEYDEANFLTTRKP
ncbi:MAG: hypothetical protein AB1488_09005 [Nitrospirota bacterium]